MGTSWRALAVMAALAVAPGRAHAESPWSVGVTEEQKAKSKELLDAGNALLLDKKYVEALDKYTAAVQVWDHPAIRFNMVRCLVQLGRNLEAYENLEKALKYGQAPLEETVYAEALAYQKLLSTQIGDIKVTCAQAGVKLTIDGQPLAQCPAQETRRLIAGPHQIVGSKPGLLPKTLDLVVIGAKQQGVEVKLEPLAAGAKIVHRWPGYLPWSIFLGGFAVGAIGGGTLFLAGDQMRTYDDIVDSKCTGRCTPEDLAPYQHLKDGAELKNAIGMTLVITGGAAVATGAVMIYLNRGRAVYPEVTPMPGGGAVSLSGSF
ncbi:MAG TPA: hypothetical protein VLB44_19740 [Kofleriaceae bacterium]|nr:hypothetical protein [Kofleriaceae bacterium]